MQKIIEELAAKVQADLANVSSKETLSAFWQAYLSKNGQVPALMKNLKNVSPEERPAVGKMINEFKTKVQAEYDAAAIRIEAAELEKRNAAEAVDITMPAKIRNMGGLHPITLVKNQIVDVFAGMGFEIFEGPEIEDDDHNFTRLNVPKNHPARDMQDTFYVFRSDSDATHSPMFHQMEGLVVDKGITLCDLQGMLDSFVRSLFGSETRTRLRPSFFPFTEPSVEVDVSCFECGGKDCSLCKGTGWIEILGGGVVNRKVLENCGIDPDVYSGIAFGIGIERIAMLKYGINNMGLLFENDLRFLKQFQE